MSKRDGSDGSLTRIEVAGAVAVIVIAIALGILAWRGMVCLATPKAKIKSAPAAVIEKTTETNTPAVKTSGASSRGVMVVSKVDLGRSIPTIDKMIAEERAKVKAGRSTPFDYKKNGGVRL